MEQFWQRDTEKVIQDGNDIFAKERNAYLNNLNAFIDDMGDDPNEVHKKVQNYMDNENKVTGLRQDKL